MRRRARAQVAATPGRPDSRPRRSRPRRRTGRRRAATPNRSCRSRQPAGAPGTVTGSQPRARHRRPAPACAPPSASTGARRAPPVAASTISRVSAAGDRPEALRPCSRSPSQTIANRSPPMSLEPGCDHGQRDRGGQRRRRRRCRRGAARPGRHARGRAVGSCATAPRGAIAAGTPSSRYGTSADPGPTSCGVVRAELSRVAVAADHPDAPPGSAPGPAPASR